MPAPHQPALIAGRLLLCEEFAAGGMASIHFGRQLGAAGFVRTVAVKRLHPHLARDPELVAMFVDEAQLAARIRHPNVVSTLDVVQHEGELLIVMEYVEGEPLSALMKGARLRGERLPLDIVSRIVCDALAGLHAAHEARSDSGEPLQIVHRDVSPSNVLVGADGVARVLDFGIAKASVRVSTTREGGLKGKLRYMAPEQVADEEVSRRTDVYAASVVLWELLVGEPLFRASNEAAWMARITEGIVVAPSRRNPELPAALDAVLLRGLARQPAARFAHAREMALELEATLPPATPHATAEWVAGAAAESFARRRLALARVETPGRWPARPTGAAAAPGERGVDDGTEGPTQLVASRARIGRAGWLVGATALLAGAVGVTWAALRPVDGLAPHQVDASAAGGHGSGAPSPASPPVDPRGSAEAPTTQGGAGTAPAPGEGGSSEGSRSGSALAVPSGAARDSAAPPTGRQAGSPPRKSGPTSCDPPYVVDAEGRRQVKRECL